MQSPFLISDVVAILKILKGKYKNMLVRI